MNIKGCLKVRVRAHTPSSPRGETNGERNSTSTIPTTSNKKCLLNLPTKANNNATSIATTRKKKLTLEYNNKEDRRPGLSPRGSL